MPRWVYGTVLVVYLAGTFGFGLAAQISGMEPDVSGAMSYGAAWPWVIMHSLNML